MQDCYQCSDKIIARTFHERCMSCDATFHCTCFNGAQSIPMHQLVCPVCHNDWNTPTKLDADAGDRFIQRFVWMRSQQRVNMRDLTSCVDRMSIASD